MATGGAFTIGARQGHGRNTESGKTVQHGSGQFAQKALAKAFGEKHGAGALRCVLAPTAQLLPHALGS